MTILKQLLLVLLAFTFASTSATTISGNLKVCTGLTTTLTIDTVGGTWSSSVPGVASINATTGVVTGIMAGGTVISYNLPGATFVRSLNSYMQPVAITGPGVVCEGSTMMFANSMGSVGTWTSADPSIATVISNGRVTGVSGGVVPITYRVPVSGCFVTREATVNALPDPITVPAWVCPGASTTLISAPSGGVWVSSNTSVATIDASSGIVTGITGGLSSYYLTVITYTLPTSCRRVAQITVNSAPGSIIGPTIMCSGGTGTLFCGTPGGTWSSSAPGVASISATGQLGAVSNGTTVVNYTKPTGCAASVTVTVSTSIAANTGVSAICVGQTTTLANGIPDGIWTSDNPSVANVNEVSGFVTGVNQGVANIAYAVGAGCNSVTQVTVNSVSTPIIGETTICEGGTTDLSYALPGGTWSSSLPAIATVNVSSGTVTGISAGTSIVTYTIGTGCFRIVPVIVQAPPSAIAGPDQVCEGNSIVLSSVPTGGSWTTGSTNASVTPSVGNVAGLSAGTVEITYTTGSSCSVTYQITVNAPPAAISGTAITCVGGTTTLISDGAGVWSSANLAKATINAANGVVTGIAAGTSVITYMPASGCFRTTVVTVTAAPTAISGTLALCPVNNTTLIATTSGKTWVSSSPSVASINATTGVVTALTAGNTTISYTVGSCSSAPVVMTINAAPPANEGVPIVCVGPNAVLLTNSVPGGTWSRSNSKVVLNPASCLGRGVSTGTVNITYTTSPGCYAVTEVTVIPAMAAITGPTSVCPGSEVELNHLVPGGTWTSTNTTNATIDAATGAVTGVNSGTTVISYVVSAACFTSRTEVVSSPPSAISGDDQICVGSINPFLISSGGGTWSTSNEAVASVSVSTGAVTGIIAGTSILTFRVTSTGCNATKEVTVNPVPAAITGATTVCTGYSISMENEVMDGVWSVNYPVRAAIDATTGEVTGMSEGTATVTYTLEGGCYSTAVITVLGAAATVYGPSSICVGDAPGFTASVGGATWVSSNETVATIDPVTGIANGLSAGTTIITYDLPSSGCLSIKSLTVNRQPTIEVTPATVTVCDGSVATLHVSETPSPLDFETTTISSGSISVAIPDNSSAGAYTELLMSSVPPGAVVGSVSVTINLTHTWMSDLIVNLTAPNGKTVNLFNRHGGSGDNMDNTVVSSDGGLIFASSAAPFTGTYSATTTMFIGAIAFSSNASFADLFSIGNGTWTLSGRDRVNADVGAFTSWSLSIAYYFPAEVTWSSTSGLYNDAGLLSPYAGSPAGTVYASFAAPGDIPVTQVYTATATNGLCSSTAQSSVTVIPGSGTITGPSSICENSMGSFTSTVEGGAWTSSNETVATIDPITRIADPLSAGTTTITYTIPSTGCFSIKPLTVNRLPFVDITPSALSICDGSDAALRLSLDNGIADASSGEISVPIPDNNSTGSHTDLLINSVPAGAVVSTVTVTINLTHTYMTDMIINLSAPNGNTLNLFNRHGSSGDNLVNTVVSSDGGLIFGSSAAPFTGTYAANATLAVGPDAFVSNVSSFADLFSIANGTWTLSGRDRANLDLGEFTSWSISVAYYFPSEIPSEFTWSSVSGLYNDAGFSSPFDGSPAGTVYASFATPESSAVTQVYTVTATNGACISTATASVTAYPGTMSGHDVVCEGNTSSFSSSAPGGTWTSSNASVATVSPSGSVDGLSLGSTYISYALGGGACFLKKAVTVNPVPNTPVITPSPVNVCPGDAAHLVADASGGPKNVYSGSISVPIPDNTPSGAFTTLAVTGIPASAVVTGVSVTLNLTHTYVGDLDINLTAPNGSTLNLFNRNYGEYDDLIDVVVSSESTTPFPFSGSFTGTFAADASIGAGASGYSSTATSFASLFSLPNGTWTLSVRDWESEDVGTIGGFDLVITYEVTQDITWSEVAGLYIDPELTDPLTVDESANAVYALITTGTAPVAQVYTVTNTLAGCSTSNTVDVLYYPSEYSIEISGSDTVSPGNTADLTCTGTGGTWSSSDTFFATVDESTGAVTGLVPGSVTIYYNNYCGTVAAHSMTINAIVPIPCLPTPWVAEYGCGTTQTIIDDFSMSGAFTTSIADINTGCNGRGYQYRIGFVPAPTLLTGSSYTATLATGGANYVFAQAWIDYNDDGELGIEETVGGTATGFMNTTSFTVSVSEAATPGVHLMRVRIGWVGSSSPYPDLSPCGDQLFGEAHDYIVNIVGAAKPGGQVTESVGDIASFSVAPNPTTGNLTINTSVAGDLAIYTIDGRELKRYAVADGSSVVAMPSGLTSGVYMLRFKGNDGSTKMMRIVYQP